MLYEITMYADCRNAFYIWSNPTKWTHLGSCPQQWGSHYYIIFKIFITDGLYSVIVRST